MAKKLNSMPGYQARMPKQPHDVSQNFTFTASTGMELPVYYDMLHLGDELHFSNSMFARLQNPITAFLGDIDFHLDYFFVPLSVIYTPAPSMFYQTDDLISGLFGTNNFQWDKQTFPLFGFDRSVRNIKDNVEGGVNASQETSNDLHLNSVNFDCWGKAIYRLCDMLDYSPLPLFTDSGTYNPNSTPWFLCAYHACHELYFRNDDREGKSYLYNLDPYYNDGSIISNSNLLQLHYVSRYKDYFNAVKVSPIGSSISMLDGNNSWEMLSRVQSYLFNNSSYGRTYATGAVMPNTESSDSLNTTVGAGNNSSSIYDNKTFFMNAANIRQLFMVDKLLRVIGRANKDYESQFLAHFGVKVPHDVMHNITHIGHDMVSMGSQPVVSQTDTYNSSTDQGSALGELGGQGYVSLSGKKFNFKAPCHGVFMVIMHVQPKLKYFAGVSKLHDLSYPTKFWQPEYDRKGMQPIFEYECTRDSAITSTRVGWQFAYEQFKRKYDKASTAYKNVYSESYDPSVNFYSPWILATRPYSHPATGYMNHEGDTYDFADFDFSDLLSTPHDLDSVMQVKYQSSWISGLDYNRSHLLFQTDPFVINYNMNCKKVNFMSEFGEPELD